MQTLSFNDDLSLASIEDCGVGDFNGDGKSDILVKTSDQIKFYSISGLTLNHQSTIDKSISEFYIQDFNNDGIDDLLFNNTKTIHYIQNYSLTGDTDGVPAPGSFPLLQNIEQFQYTRHIIKSVSYVFMIKNMLATSQANSFRYIFSGIGSEQSKSTFLNWVENKISNSPPPLIPWENHTLTYDPNDKGGTYFLTLLPREYKFHLWERSYTGKWHSSG